MVMVQNSKELGCGAVEDAVVHNRYYVSFFFQAEDGIRDLTVTGVQTCALPISSRPGAAARTALIAYAAAPSSCAATCATAAAWPAANAAFRAAPLSSLAAAWAWPEIGRAVV